MWQVFPVGILYCYLIFFLSNFIVLLFIRVHLNLYSLRKTVPFVNFPRKRTGTYNSLQPLKGMRPCIQIAGIWIDLIFIR